MKSPSACPRAALLAAALVASSHYYAAGLSLGSANVQALGTAKPDFDHLRHSVVRIQAVASSFDWMYPFIPGADSVGLGSGFVAQVEPYPLFVTNAHVISDAKQVTLQLLLYGGHHWEAEVVSVCPKFDIALLVLRQPKEFMQAMASRNISLQALRLAKGAAAMGEDVVALGFPLGQDALKISKGNIAGNEDVDGNICIQSTAPISPGSSGGPLLDAAAQEVIGVNFAKATEGENINYVIPAWRVTQMIAKHLQDQPGTPADGQWRRLLVQVPKAELTTIHPDEALYALSGGCHNGIYVSRVGNRSVFRRARPPVPEGSFLVAVNGRELDRFGTGLHEGYAADRVDFRDLFFMVEDLSSEIEVETCQQGQATKHLLSMAWAPDYERGIRYIDEPRSSGMATEYEIFGDVSVMQMTVNHISEVLSRTGDPGPARWLHPDFVAQPRLMINYVRSGSYAATVVGAGAAVSTVNGHDVRTLAEFREHFLPKEGSDIWTLETDMGRVVALMFNESLIDQLHQAVKLHASHLLTPGIVSAAEGRGLIKDSQLALSGAFTSEVGGRHQGAHAQPLLPHAAAQLGAKHVAQLAVSAPASAPAAPEATAAGPLLARPASAERRGFATQSVAPVAWHLPEV